MIAMDPKNPKTLYAGMWDFRRKGWTFRSGGDGPTPPAAAGCSRPPTAAPLDRTERQSAKGLPSKPWGRVAVAVAPSKSSVVYAFIEAEPPKNGLYRSDDGGMTWQALDRSQNMVWRPFYFANLIVDPNDQNKVYKTDGGLIVSNDGGKTLQRRSAARPTATSTTSGSTRRTPTTSSPATTAGSTISYDAGNNWVMCMTLPISQFYHVSADMDTPYNVYGGLQDNSSWVGVSRYPGGIGNARWENMYGGDGFWMFADPTDHDYLYAEAQGGEIGAGEPEDPRGQEHQAPARLQGGEAPVPLEHPDPHQPHGQEHALHRRAVPLPVDRPRAVLGPHLSRPHHQRPGETEAGAVGRRHGRQLGGRDAHHDLRYLRIDRWTRRSSGWGPTTATSR